MLDTPLAAPFKTRAARVGSVVGAFAAAAELFLWPSLLVSGVSARAYAQYGADMTPLFRVFFVLSAALLGYGAVAVSHAVWRAGGAPGEPLSQRLRGFVDVILYGASGAAESRRHLRAFFWVFTLRDLLMVAFFLAIAFRYYDAPTTDLGVVLHFWWSPFVDMMTGGLLVWHTFSDHFAKERVSLSAPTRAKHLAGWLCSCLWLPLAWAASVDAPAKWLIGCGLAFSATVLFLYVREGRGSAFAEVRDKLQGPRP